jgi:hypothetical protein
MADLLGNPYAGSETHQSTGVDRHLLKMMLAAKNAVPYCPLPAAILFAGAVCILRAEAVIDLQIRLALLARGYIECGQATSVGDAVALGRPLTFCHNWTELPPE